MKPYEILHKFNRAFEEAATAKQQAKAIDTYIRENIEHGYMLPMHIQGPIKKGTDGWGLRKKDTRVETDPWSAYTWR